MDATEQRLFGEFHQPTSYFFVWITLKKKQSWRLKFGLKVWCSSGTLFCIFPYDANHPRDEVLMHAGYHPALVLNSCV
jgi:hypothetical protein